MTTRKSDVSFSCDINADDLKVTVNAVRKVEGQPDEVLGKQEFLYGPLMDSPIYHQWVGQAIFTTLSARASSVSGFDKLAEMVRHFEVWVEGEWRPERKAGTRTIPAWIEAVARIKGATVAAVQDGIRKLDKAQADRLRNSPQVLAMIKTMEAEAEASLDLGDLVDDES